jgi:hypothetical protein
VLEPLRSQPPLGRAAAVHASLFYVAARQAQARAGASGPDAANIGARRRAGSRF